MKLPLTSAAHRDRVLSYLKIAVDEGAEVLAGGGPPDDPALARCVPSFEHDDRAHRRAEIGLLNALQRFLQVGELPPCGARAKRAGRAIPRARYVMPAKLRNRLW